MSTKFQVPPSHAIPAKPSGNPTPGEWIVMQQGEADEYCLIESNGNWIFAFRQNGSMSLGEQYANARLIAAAPDLLETLRTCLVMSELQEKRHGYSIENAKIAENIRFAIAEATGE